MLSACQIKLIEIHINLWFSHLPPPKKKKVKGKKRKKEEKKKNSAFLQKELVLSQRETKTAEGSTYLSISLETTNLTSAAVITFPKIVLQTSPHLCLSLDFEVLNYYIQFSKVEPKILHCSI